MAAGAIIKGIGESLKGVLDSFDKLVTSKDERMKNDNQLAEIRNELAEIQKDIYDKAADVEIELVKAKSTALQGEINGNWLQRSWRPLLMLCFGGIIIYQYFLVHLINVILAAFHVQYDGSPLYFSEFELPDRFWTLLEIGVGGYIAGRSLEKVAPNVTKKIVDARESRRMTEELAMKIEDRQKRREFRQEKWERRQDRKDERQEDKINRLEHFAELEKEGVVLTKKQQRQKRRLERKLRGKKKIDSLFKTE